MTTREEWLTQAVDELRPVFELSGFPLPEKIRVTCGFPSRMARALHRRVGECWSPSASSDGTHEILISPVVADKVEVLAILAHELCHAATPGDGHGAKFRRAARALYLEGKLTSTYAGDRFKAEFYAVLEGLGDYPHAVLNVGTDQKKQSTRMLKAVCTQCGYTIRLTKLWADRGLPLCSCGINNEFVLEA